MAIREALKKLGHDFAERVREFRAPLGAALTPRQRRELRELVADMEAVALLQGTEGWAVIQRHLVKDKAELAQEILVRMSVHRFRGAAGVEKRGEYLRTDRLFNLCDEIIKRGADAQKRLNLAEDAGRDDESARVLRV